MGLTLMTISRRITKTITLKNLATCARNVDANGIVCTSY